MSEKFWLSNPKALLKPKLNFLSYSTRNERYNAVTRLLILAIVAITIIFIVMDKSKDKMYYFISIVVVIIVTLIISYYVSDDRMMVENYVPFTVTPAYS